MREYKARQQGAHSAPPPVQDWGMGSQQPANTAQEMLPYAPQGTSAQSQYNNSQAHYPVMSGYGAGQIPTAMPFQMQSQMEPGLNTPVVTNADVQAVLAAAYNPPILTQQDNETADKYIMQETGSEFEYPMEPRVADFQSTIQGQIHTVPITYPVVQEWESPFPDFHDVEHQENLQVAFTLYHHIKHGSEWHARMYGEALRHGQGGKRRSTYHRLGEC